MSKHPIPPAVLTGEPDVDWEELPEKEVHPFGELVQGLSTKEVGILKRAYLERERLDTAQGEVARAAQAVTKAQDVLRSLKGKKGKKIQRAPVDALQASAEQWRGQEKELGKLTKALGEARDVILRLAMNDEKKDQAEALQQLIFGEDLPPEEINAAQVETMKKIDECLKENGADLSSYSRNEIEMYRRWVMGAFYPINRRGLPIDRAQATKAYRSNHRKGPNKIR